MHLVTRIKAGLAPASVILEDVSDAVTCDKILSLLLQKFAGVDKVNGIQN